VNPHDGEVEMSGGEMVKIAFAIARAAPGRITGETLWAERVGRDRFRLANTPFHVRGVSFGDVVFGREAADGRLAFAGVSIRGGHSTVWLTLVADHDGSVFRAAWAPLRSLGCTYEGFQRRFLAVDVPPCADLAAVRRILRAGEAAGAWDEVEEAHCGHLRFVGEVGEAVAAWRV
jgi:hypothetical protein